MGLFDKIKNGISSWGEDDITWYCDGCNSILNNQPGFNTDSGTWECTVCGHINDVTENNVYESEDAYQEAMGIPRCPCCGGRVKGDAPDATFWFNCTECGRRFYLEDGVLYDPFERRPGGETDDGQQCINCGGALNGGKYVAPWEDGSNSSGYVICPHCGCYNYVDY